MFNHLLALPLAALLLLGGCASTLTTQVTSFHQLPDGLQGQRFVIVPSAEQQNSLEFDAYAALVREALAGKGLVDAGDALGADLAVTMSYTVSGGSSGVSTDTGGYAGFGAGSGGFSMGGVGIGIGFPIGSGRGGGGDSVVFQRSLRLEIDRTAGRPAEGRSTGAGAPAPAAGSASARVFEARATSEGPSASLAPVMRAMVQAVFEEFPGPSGRTRVVRVPVNE